MRPQLTALEIELRKVDLPMEVPGVDQARKNLREILNQLHNYLIPRFDQWDAPILIVIGGSTGAGKSTLVNALVGEEISPASAIRPTTKTPVLVHHPADTNWFRTSSILPSWVKDATSAAGMGTDEPTLAIRVSEALPSGVAIIDSPDIDSLEEMNRVRARELFDVADAWIFGTTAMRYADAVPWEYLKQARERNVVTMIVLSRTNCQNATEVGEDLRRLLQAQGLGSVPTVSISEKPGEQPSKIAPRELEPIRRWLNHFTAEDSRDELVRQTAIGATASVVRGVGRIQKDVELQRSHASALVAVVEKNFVTTEISAALSNGELLRGEVLRQWHEFLGTGEYLRRLESGVSRARDWLTGIWRKPVENNLRGELEDGFVALVLSTVASAVQATWQEWERDPAGLPLLSLELALPSPGLKDAAAEQMRQWQAGILELVRQQADSKRSGARLAAYSVNAVGLALMIVAFASTGGLVGAEVAIAGGTALLAQRILEAIFGEHGVRTLATQAQDDLLKRAEHLFVAEADRFEEVLPQIPTPDLETTLRSLEVALRGLQ